MPDVTFTDGLTKTSANYLSDDGNEYRISIRLGYTDSGTVTLAAPATVNTPLPKGSKPRKLHLESVAAVNGKFIRRSVPCSIQDITNYKNQANPQVTVDGIAFKVLGFTGEKRIG